ncbi:MAG: UDP-N-acetylglucosamine 1-carboxyvinyltransferase [Ardenticatenales bacterium]
MTLTLTDAPVRPPAAASPERERVYVLRGGARLSGTVQIGGAKNVALPILAATLLTADPCVIENVPDIADIRVMLDLLRHMGATIDFDPTAGRVTIACADIRTRTTPDGLAERFRGSFLVMGPLLARFGQASTARPGGCNIGSRPVDVHSKGFRALGAEVANVDHRFAASGKLKGASILLDVPSHTGTENIIMAAVLAEGLTVIENASIEPEVLDLVDFLRSLGARIAWTSTARQLVIQGVPRLHGTVYRLMPDRLEAGTYLLAGAITRGDVTVERVVPDHLRSVTSKLVEAGARIEERDHSVRVIVDGPLTAVDVHTYFYPGFPTDLQQPFTALLTQATGESIVQETVFEARMTYAYELQRMGADVRVNGSTAFVNGPCRLHGTTVTAHDLRAGAAVMLAALTAEGDTLIRAAHTVERGYNGLIDNLCALGAVGHADWLETIPD